MRTSSVRDALRGTALILPLLAACATTGPASSRRQLSGPQLLAHIRDSIETSLAERDGVEEQSSEPRVRIIAPALLGADKSVDAAIRVSEDAYVLVAAADLDGRFRVVFPESPTESGFIAAGQRRQLSKFFAGFGGVGLARYGRSAFSLEPVGFTGARGMMVAVASDRPLQLERLSDGAGGWNEAEIERLVRYQSARAAAYSLGEALSLVGQQFDADYSPFTQMAGTPMYAAARYGSSLCESAQTGALYFDGPQPTRFFVRDEIQYATVTFGDACSGYETRTFPVGPANRRVPAPIDTAVNNPDGAAMGTRTAHATGERLGRFSERQLDGTVGRARRAAPISGEDAQLRPVDRPPTTALRFRPPERLRAEPRVNEGAGDFRTRPLPIRGEREGREPGERRPPRAEPVRQEPARQEPMHAEPMRAAPSEPRPAPMEPSSGKPLKEN